MRRGCLIGAVMLLGLCVLGCGLLYFVGLPQFRDAIGDEFEDAISTEVARQLAPRPGQTPAPGVYRITEESLRQNLEEEAEGGNVDDVIISIAPSGIEFGFRTRDQDLVYTGDVAAANGRLVVTDLEANSDFIEFLFPARDMADAIESGVNDYLIANNLRLADVEPREGELILDVEAAS